MRKSLLLVAVILFVFSCNDNSGKKKKRLLPESVGKLYNISVVVDNELWKNTVGETLRDVLAAPLDGLPQEEPLFSLSQIPTQVFSGFTRNSRSIIKIEQGVEAGIKITNDAFARPQKFIVVSGKNLAEIKTQIKENSDTIISAFKSQELKEKQRRIRKSLYKATKVEEKLGLSIQFSTAYRVAKAEENFFWIRKDIPTGTVNLMLYELPIDAIKQDENIINQIISIRDSIGKTHIPGPVEGTYMVTDKNYSPHVFKTTLDNKPTIEFKGVWDVKNAFMSGPFIDYIIEDKANNRLIVAEGFAYAPSVDKRNHIYELEAMIHSIKIK